MGIGHMFVFATLFALSVAIPGSQAPVSARKLNSSTIGSTQDPKKQGEKSRQSPPPAVNRCDPSRPDRTDLSGTYVGKVNDPDAGLRGNATLTIKGNEFWLTAGSVSHSGQITALTLCGQTTATMLFGDITQRPRRQAPLGPVSLMVQQQNGRFILMMDSGGSRSFSFVQIKEDDSMSASAKAENRAPRESIPKTVSGNASLSGVQDISAVRIVEFPWPPPAASAFVVIPVDLLNRANTQLTLGMVAERLQKTLNRAGYHEISWYEIPEGFVLVSQPEQFDSEGWPLAGTARFAPELFSAPIRNAWDYITRLVLSQTGHFRVMVFAVSSIPFSQRNVQVSRDEARAWLSGGANGLPGKIAKMPFSAEHTATALIYEFEQASTDSPATLKRPGSLTAMTHLERCQIWRALATQ